MTSADIQRETVDLAARLIACRSVTPSDAGALDVVAARLSAAGFTCERIDRGGIGNLWAFCGSGSPLVCLAGHTDDGLVVFGSFSVMRPMAAPTPEKHTPVSDPLLVAKIVATQKILGQKYVSQEDIWRLEREGKLDGVKAAAR